MRVFKQSSYEKKNTSKGIEAGTMFTITLNEIFPYVFLILIYLLI